MQDGVYRLQYKTTTLDATGVVVLNNGILSGCDRYYFMCGEYQRNGGRLHGEVTFKCHTSRPDILAIIPQQFALVFDGVGSDSFGQFDVRCPAIPLIHGSATFTWLGSLNR